MFDVIKKSVLDQFAQGISIADMLWSLGVAFLMGLFILLVYKQTFRGVLFSKGYAFSLVLLAMVTALVIRTISSNLALSLGMVGALSIVRFRTASQRASRRRAGKIRMRMPLRTSPRATDTRNAASI